MIRKWLMIGLVISGILLCYSNSGIAQNRIIITPDKTTVTVGTTITITANVYIQGTITYPRLTWRCGAKGEIIPVGTNTAIYTALLPGTETITVSVPFRRLREQITIRNIEAEILRVEIFPYIGNITAGTTQKFQAICTFTDGKTQTVNGVFSSSSKEITPEGIYTPTKAGRDIITVEFQNKRSFLNIEVLPDKLDKVIPIVKQPIFFGTIYNITQIFDVKGLDKYGNEVEISPAEKATFSCDKIEIGDIKKFIGNTGIKIVDKYLDTCFIINGQSCLFFEPGIYEITVEVGDKKGSISYPIKIEGEDLLYPFEFQIKRLNFEVGTIEGNLLYQNYLIPFSLTLNKLQKELFDRDYWGKANIICYVYFRMLEACKKYIESQEKLKLQEILKKLEF